MRYYIIAHHVNDGDYYYGPSGAYFQDKRAALLMSYSVAHAKIMQLIKRNEVGWSFSLLEVRK